MKFHGSIIDLGEAGKIRDILGSFEPLIFLINREPRVKVPSSTSIVTESTAGLLARRDLKQSRRRRKRVRDGDRYLWRAKLRSSPGTNVQ